jgi:hypothetical protein
MKGSLILLLFVSEMAFGQITPKDIPDQLNLNSVKDLLKEKEFQRFRERQLFNPYFLNREKEQQIPDGYPDDGFDKDGEFSYSIANSSVYILPIDHMPCRVPDMSKVERMLTPMLKADADDMPVAGPRYRLRAPHKLIK